MRLADLDPRWWGNEGRTGQGIVFRCPCCRKVWLCVAFANPIDGGTPFDIGTNERRPWRALWHILYGDLRDASVRWRVIEKGVAVVPPGTHWTRAGETFDLLSLAPSVDASKSGHWHGFVTNGEVS